MHPDRTGQGLGSAGLDPAAPLIAGAKVKISVRYTVGERGLSWTGGLRLTVPYGFSPPQFTCVTDDGYLTAVIETPGREGLKMEFFLPHSVIGEIHNEYMTRWGRFVFLRPVGGDLTRGDVVRIDYGRNPFYPQVMARAPLFAGRFHFDVAVDPDGSGEYLLVQPTPEVEVRGGDARGALIVAPSVVRPGEAFELRIVPEDALRNAASGGLGGPVQVFRDWEPVTEAPSLEGRWRREVKAGASEGVSFFQVEAGNAPAGESNPQLVTGREPALRLVWGDLHAHTRASDGLGSPAEMYAFARDAAALDFAATADHSLQMNGDDWEEIQAAAESANEPGRFIALPGYEINDRHGERCVYFMEPGEGLYHHMSDSHREETSRLEDLIRQGRALLIPHFHGAEMGGFNPGIIRLIEIYSIWGAFEFKGNPRSSIAGPEYATSFAASVWARGYVAGVTAGSDCHAGHPGRTDWLRHMHGNRGGLTGVWVKDLTRKGLWEALIERRCYGTTGDRTIVEFSVDGRFMGSEFRAPAAPRVVRARVIAHEPVASLAVIRNGQELTVAFGSSEDESMEITDENPPAKVAWYCLRATLASGERAWSSPVWVSIE